jgi:serine/threonine protein phosphatase PrpC
MDDLAPEDFRMQSINKNNDLLLCTDGFYTLMEGQEQLYFRLFQMRDLQTVKKRLLSSQLGKNSDDATYILIRHDF